MEIWIVTVGVYDDEVVVGLGTTEADAYRVLSEALADERWSMLAHEGNAVNGPYPANVLLKDA